MNLLVNTSPVLPAKDIASEIQFFETLGFKNIYDSLNYSDQLDYAVMNRDTQSIHLQLFGDQPFYGQQVKIWVTDIAEINVELKRTELTVNRNFNTPWNTNELGLYSPSGHAIFFVHEIS